MLLWTLHVFFESVFSFSLDIHPMVELLDHTYYFSGSIFVVVVQLLNHVWLFVTAWAAACQAPLSFTISQSLLKLKSIESVMPSNHLILCHPLLLLSSVFPSISIFFSELALCIRRPEYWSFSFSISPSNEYSELISLRIDQFDLLTIQGTLKSLFQHHSYKASILWCSAIFMVQLSHQYTTNGKTIALTVWTFVSKMMSLVFNMLSRFVIAFLPRSKCLLTWLHEVKFLVVCYLVSMCFSFTIFFLCWFLASFCCCGEKKCLV